jgi:hypothetical protein
MVRTREVLITSFLVFSTTTAVNCAFAQSNCSGQWMACKVQCSTRHGPPPIGSKDDPMIMRGCEDSCDAAKRLCDSAEADEARRRREAEQRQRH